MTRYDRRGYGLSSGVEGPFSNIRDLYFFFEGSGIERAGLMGMSAGGGLAVDFALAYPGKVSFLVLVGSVVGGLDFTDHMYNYGKGFDEAAAALRRIIDEDPWETMVPTNIGGRTLALAFNPQNPNTIWVGTDGGGLWASRSTVGRTIPFELKQTPRLSRR